MKVIGASFPRTGTMSTKAALERLGLNPCYHFVTQFERPQDIDVWLAAADGKMPDWKALFADFQAAVDWPTSFFYKELMEVYPDAKVLLNSRDPEKWYQSISTTVYPVTMRENNANVTQAHASETLIKLGWQGMFGGRFEDKDYAIEVFNKHNQAVQDDVPRERLLVWEPTQGWGPLAAFLGVEAPDEPFPRLNDNESFRARFM